MHFDEVWDRIKKETPLRTFIDLAELLKTSQSNVSRQKKEGNFPGSWAYLVARHYGLLTEWIMSGEGPKRLEETKESEGESNIKNMMSSYLEGAVNALRTIEQKDSVSFISCLDNIHKTLQKIEESEKEAKKSVVNGSPI